MMGIEKSEIIKKYLENNKDIANRELAKIILLENPGIWKDIESVRGIIRYHKGANGDENRSNLVDKSFVEEFDINSNSLLKKISELYTPQELVTIAKGKGLSQQQKSTVVNFSGKHVRIGLIGDTHIGSKYFDKNWLFQAFDEFKKERVDFICHTGDVTEGMGTHAGQIYELSQIGYDAQRKEAVNVFGQWADTDIYSIDGNHDRWYIKGNGALMVPDIAMMLPNFKFIGHDEGNIKLNYHTIIKLWHGEDGNSYAHSYRIQKVVESFTGGEKPNVLFLGHVHKSMYVFDRNIQCYSAGCIEKQSKWMRGKRLPAHTGFWVVDLWLNESGVSKSQGCWYPFYSDNLESTRIETTD